MEKQGIPPNGFESPPPPYVYGGHGAPPAAGGAVGLPPAGGYDMECQKAPLYPSMPPGPGYPAGPPQGSPYCTQPVGYGQQPQTVVFVQPIPLANPPQDHLGYSIFVTICCCWIVGIFAIIKAAECRSAVAAGDRTTAELKSRQARKLANIALGLGIASIVVLAALFGIYYAVVISHFPR